jgi:hypothetical protein
MKLNRYGQNKKLGFNKLNEDEVLVFLILPHSVLQESICFFFLVAFIFPLSLSDSHLLSLALCFLLCLSFFVHSFNHLVTCTLITFYHFLIIEFVLLFTVRNGVRSSYSITTTSFAFSSNGKAASQESAPL